jgi:hypothetical protein
MEYPLFEGNIRALHPEIKDEQTGDSFPVPVGYAKVETTYPPAVPAGFKSEEIGPVFDGTKWVLAYRTVLKTEADYRYDTINANTEENEKIKRYQYTAKHFSEGPDCPQTTAWKDYYDALEEYRLSYPRSGKLPHAPRFDENGNVVTLNNSGSAPNVIG